MADRLNPKIMEILTEKLGKKPKDIRPRLSELRRKHSGLTMNAAAQMYAQSKGKSIMANLDQTDRQSLASVQAVQVSVSNVSKVDRRTLNIHSPVNNVSFGDKNTVTQTVITLSNELEELLQKIDASDKLSENQKNDYQADIQTIVNQAEKSKPNPSIIKAAWESVKGLAAIEGFVQSVDRIEPLIKTLLG